MAYKFKQEQSIAQNINRILMEETQAALESLENPGELTGETIHGVRKRIKKIRALFRLVRSELKEKDFQRANRHYRRIGQRLSQLRDTTVMIKTFNKLREARPGLLSPSVFGTIQTTLIDQQEQVTRAFFENPARIRNLTDAFKQASRKVTGLSKHANRFGLMAPNLKGVYRRARKALKVVTLDPSIDQLHELRKDVKTLWYHTRLLQSIWPELFKAYEQTFGQLGELLGDDHDFGVLAQAIESDRLRLRNKRDKEVVLQGLRAQRVHLQEQIFPLANRLLAEKASRFVKRFGLYWKLWRAEASRQPATQP